MIKKVFFLIILASSLSINAAQSDHWGYQGSDDPAHWENYHQIFHYAK